MNFIEDVQKKYFKGFYEGRYAERKKLALDAKDKLLRNPRSLSVY